MHWTYNLLTSSKGVLTLNKHCNKSLEQVLKQDQKTLSPVKKF